LTTLGEPRSRRQPRRHHRPEDPQIRLLVASAHHYLDPRDPASAALRRLVAGLGRAGCPVEVLTGSTLGDAPEDEPARLLAALGHPPTVVPLNPPTGSPAPDWPHPPAHLEVAVDGVAVHLLRGPTTRPHEPDEAERHAFAAVLGHLIARDRPDALIAHEADPLAAVALLVARQRGIPATLRLRHRGPHDHDAVAAADILLAPGHALAAELHEGTGRPCLVLPDFLDPDSVRADDGDRRYLAFLDPTPAGGLAPFARIADELGRRRPDIPLLVVAGPEGRAALDACGLDLRRHGTVDLMRPPVDPGKAWGRVRAVLLPDLDGTAPALAALAALANGLPVIASDRGALPEALGDAGTLLPLPGHLTAATMTPPTADEVAPWLDAVTRFWDDPDHYADQCRKAQVEARRWTVEEQVARYRAVVDGLRPRAAVEPSPPGRSKSVVLVPHLDGVEPECEDGLGRLERLGVRVVRRRGSSQVDVVRNEMASDALHDGFDSILFVDADLGFDHRDALRLLARPEPVVSAFYAKKGPRELASILADGVPEVLLGPESPGPYPLKYAAAGFLRIRASALRLMIERLHLPLCNLDWGRGCWPFFQPLIAEAGGGRPHYLGEDWAFSHRLRQVGITPLADATIRLYHFGRHGFSWEEAGDHRPRHRSYRFRP